MANPEDRYSNNVDGVFYVDTRCIDCDLCQQIAPAIFTRDNDGSHSIVYNQPYTDDEIALAEEALDNCPVDAIGKDG